MNPDKAYRPPRDTRAPVSPDRRLLRLSPVVLAVGLAVFAESQITVEWSPPSCMDSQDGPVEAVFGAPLPYERFSGASSGEYDFMPHVYLLDVAILSMIVWGLLRRPARRAAIRWPRFAVFGMGLPGALLCAFGIAWHAMGPTIAAVIPVTNIAAPPRDSYSRLRPVGLVTGPHYDCTPSPFWFGAGPATPRP